LVECYIGNQRLVIQQLCCLMIHDSKACNRPYDCPKQVAAAPHYYANLEQSST
jgi:hypothetical protein